MFIVFEGMDGCGKSTHAKMLAQWLTDKGEKVVLTVEPTKGEIGGLIRKVLSGKVNIDAKTLALLFTADRVEHVKEIQKAVDEGKIMISDRYYHSTVAYQAAQGIDRKWLMELNNFAPQPDIIFFLDVSSQQAEERAQSGEIFEKKEFLEKVKKEYMKFEGLTIIDATREKDIVQKEIREKIMCIL